MDLATHENFLTMKIFKITVDPSIKQYQLPKIGMIFQVGIAVQLQHCVQCCDTGNLALTMQ